MGFSFTDIEDLLIYEPRIIQDERGYFFEAFNDAVFKAQGLEFNFVQDNQSHSTAGVIRGLHYQLNPFAQTKLIRVIQGTILDIAVDLRRSSKTYGQHFSVELSEANKKQLLIPKGFAHGFSVLSETATVLYKCDHLYNRESEAGIRFNDPDLKIDWKIQAGKEIVSAKDLDLPKFKDCKNNF